MINLRELFVSIYTVFIQFCYCHMNIVIFKHFVCSLSKSTWSTVLQEDVIYGSNTWYASELANIQLTHVVNKICDYHGYLIFFVAAAIVLILYF
jgi:hypothetical protein